MRVKAVGTEAILTAAYHIIRNQTTYVDLTPNHFKQHNRQKSADHLVRQLAALGYSVELKPAA